MAFEHRDADPKQCKASVSNGPRTMSFHQCMRKPWKAGWCRQHHPDNEKARSEASVRRYQEELAARDRNRNKAGARAFFRWLKHNLAKRELLQTEAQNEFLEDIVEALTAQAERWDGNEG